MNKARLRLAMAGLVELLEADFCAMIRGEAEPIVSVPEALRSLEVTLAVAEAARSGRRVPCFPE